MKPTVSDNSAVAPAAETPTPGPRVERGKQLVLDQNAGFRQGVHQGALTRVGVANQRDRRHIPSAGDLAFLSRLDLRQLGFELLNPVRDQSPVFFELLFARAANSDAPLVPREVGPHPLQTRHGVFQLCQLDLQMGLVGLSMCGEDIQDHFGAVNDLDSSCFSRFRVWAGPRSLSKRTTSASWASTTFFSSSTLPEPMYVAISI